MFTNTKFVRESPSIKHKKYSPEKHSRTPYPLERFQSPTHNRHRNQNYKFVSDKFSIPYLQNSYVITKEDYLSSMNKSFKNSENINNAQKQIKNNQNPFTKSVNQQKLIDIYNLTPRNTQDIYAKKSIQPPNTHLSALFEIYSSGPNYYTGLSTSGGLGFLITKNLALTTSNLISNETFARKVFCQFLDNQEVCQFNPDQFFYTNSRLNITIVYIEVVEDRKPLDIREDFKLSMNDTVYLIGQSSANKIIHDIDDEFFYYTSGSYIPSGTPIFSIR